MRYDRLQPFCPNHTWTYTWLLFLALDDDRSEWRCVHVSCTLCLVFVPAFQTILCCHKRSMTSVSRLKGSKKLNNHDHDIESVRYHSIPHVLYIDRPHIIHSFACAPFPVHFPAKIKVASSYIHYSRLESGSLTAWSDAIPTRSNNG